MSRLAVVVGVRSQFIKLAGLLHLQRMHPAFPEVELQLVNTGQHYDKALTIDLLEADWPAFDVVFRNDPSISPTGNFGDAVRSLCRLWEVDEKRPQSLLVFGDGNPAAVGAIAAAKAGIPVVHVEAGETRGGHEQEEINRRLTDSVASLYLCVSERGAEVLLNEGRSADSVLHVGDLSYPYMLAILDKYVSLPAIEQRLLITLHRPENMTREIVAAAVDAARSRGLVDVNAHPRLQAVLRDMQLSSDVSVLEPMSYRESLQHLARCRAVVTDSGGLIREGHLLNVPTVVRRDAGGWPRLADGVRMVRCGRDRDEIARALITVEASDVAPRRTRRPGESELLPVGGVDAALAALAAFVS